MWKWGADLYTVVSGRRVEVLRREGAALWLGSPMAVELELEPRGGRARLSVYDIVLDG
jgi:hypothetical protein